MGTILPLPVIYSNTNIVTTNQLRILGIGLKGALKLDLYFDPPLYNNIAYDIVSQLPLKSNEINLRLRKGYQWRATPGSVVLIGLDLGIGPVRLNNTEHDDDAQ